MPRVNWPVRKIRCVTPARVPNSAYFYCNADDRPSLHVGALVRHAGAKRWIGLGRNSDEHTLWRNEARTLQVNPVPVDFVLDVDVALIRSFPRRPILSDPSATAVTSVTNPLRTTAWTIGEPRFEGSVEIQTISDGNDRVVEAFVDALSDVGSWFELPLPGEHLGDSDVAGYDNATGNIKLAAQYSANLTGYFGRVGRRTCRVIYHAVDWDTGSVRDYHTIRIAPSGLIDGTTSANAANVFASGATCRARATAISSTGESDDEGLNWVRWVIDWEETRGEDVIP